MPLPWPIAPSVPIVPQPVPPPSCCSASTPVGSRHTSGCRHSGAAAITVGVAVTGTVAGSAYGAQVSPEPLRTPYCAYIASFSSTISEVCCDNRKWVVPSATISALRAWYAAIARSSSVGHGAVVHGASARSPAVISASSRRCAHSRGR